MKDDAGRTWMNARANARIRALAMRPGGFVMRKRGPR